ncbi:hypothetical protein [Parenemella sanctibonifatiensis]|uniref:Gram-positive cocci surface proteins LPxTG domain-containing protein n=1 Tax=Parenemella sanctibonifatiensis TaxID=2016505 RepID=A0A255EI48_9ACTN|nr:hypothetical protein [Parenemella sanctibonifatiensis]OYN89295.1 hypothetical protein CGZ92_02970 [Parenemella sanctibonifatiensis]
MLRKLLAGTAALAIAGFGVVSMANSAAAEETPDPSGSSSPSESAPALPQLAPSTDSSYTLDGTTMNTTGSILFHEDNSPAPAGITVQIVDADGEVRGEGTTNDQGAFDFTANVAGTIDDEGCPDVYLHVDSTDEYEGFTVQPACQPQEDPSGSASPSSTPSGDDNDRPGLPDTGAPAVAGLAALGLTATAAGATLVIRRKK